MSIKINRFFSQLDERLFNGYGLEPVDDGRACWFWLSVNDCHEINKLTCFADPSWPLTKSLVVAISSDFIWIAAQKDSGDSILIKLQKPDSVMLAINTAMRFIDE